MIKKLLISFSVICMTWLSAMAVPAKPGFTLFTQSDGTRISVQCVGDEFYSCFTTKDNLVVERAQNGDWYYKTKDGITNVLAHDQFSRSENEIAFINNATEALKPGTQMSETARQLIRKVNGLRKVAQVPGSGSVRIPILLVNYNDLKMTHTKEDFQAKYMTDAKSVYQYFYDQSNGKFKPQFDIYGIFELDSIRSYYGAHGTRSNGSTTNDIRVGTMVGEAVDKASAAGEINWSNYDNDGNGECDVVIVVYAGVGEAQASTTVQESIWPCQWNLYSAKYYGDGTGSRTYNNTKIDKFAVFNEVKGKNDVGNLDGIGTFCHEFSHCLGLPDFYETTYAHGYYGMGAWSLLDYGCYSGNGDTPVGYLAYEKNFMGWIDLITPTEYTQFTLPAMNQKNATTDQAVKIVSDLNSNEYYILENKQKQNWDQYVGGSGLLITHVTYSDYRWRANTVNNQAVQLMTIAAADNVYSRATESADCWGNGSSDFTDSSTPAAVLNMTEGGDITGSAGYLGKPVTGITQNSDGTVSFNYLTPSTPIAPVMQDADESSVGKHQFRAEWTHSSDPQYVSSYTLEVTQKGESKIIQSHSFSDYTVQADEDNYLIDCSDNASDFLPTGWKATSPLYIFNGYATTGNTIKTCDYDFSAYKKVTVKITGKLWNSTYNPAQMQILTSKGSATLSWTSTTETEASCTLDVGASDKITLQYVGNYPLYIKDITIYGGDINAEPVSTSAETAECVTETFSGITDKSAVVTGLTANTTYYYKVKALYTTGEESKWSNRGTVTTSYAKTGSLADLMSSLAVGDEVSLTGNQLVGAASFTAENGDKYLIVKDGDNAVNNYVEIPDGVKAYNIEGKSQESYSQNNWILIKTDDADTYVGKAINYIDGAVTNATSLELAGEEIETGDEAQYTPNTYCPVNFMGNAIVSTGSDASTQESYFFMVPKDNEYARIAYAVYAGDNKFSIPAHTDVYNANDFSGGFYVSNDYCKTAPSFTIGETYAFNAIIKKETPKTSVKGRNKIASKDDVYSTTYTVYPVNYTGNLATGIDDVKAANTAVSTRYYNVMGAESTTPFTGVNIVVTRYSDGSMISKKEFKY